VRHLFYTLDDANNVIPCYSAATWAEWFQRATETRRRWVASTVIGDGTRISTVFLGIDQNYGTDIGPPMVFETMIFYGGNFADEMGQWRHATWDRAASFHTHLVHDMIDRFSNVDAVLAEVEALANEP
jgi:hypothetical protein